MIVVVLCACVSFISYIIIFFLLFVSLSLALCMYGRSVRSGVLRAAHMYAMFSAQHDFLVLNEPS